MPTAPLRFCMVTTFYPPYHFGGDAIFVRDLSHALVAQGHSVEIVHCEDAYRLRGSEPKAPPQNNGMVVHRLHSRLGAISPLITQQTGRPGLKRSALRRIFEKSFDVIHFHNISLVGGPGILAMGDAPVKLYTTHEHWLVCPTHVLWKNRSRPCEKPECLRCCLISGTPPQLWRYTGLIGRSLRHVDALLSPSAFTAQRHRDGGITAPIHLLPTFVTMEPQSQIARAGGQRPHFLYVGRLIESKGVIDLVDQFTRLPQYDLSIAGGGELLEPLRQRAAGHDHIRLLGPVQREKLNELYRQATAVIMPTIGPEVFALVALEAMACGTPVIVRQAGGSAEAIEATGGGVVYQNADELTPAVHRVAADPQWRDELAQKALTGYQERYTAQAHLQRYMEIIAQIQQSKQPARTS